MLTAHDEYKASHAGLHFVFKGGTSEQVSSLCKITVDKYLENRNIWMELEHYRDKGTILGKHPVFSRLQKSNEIRTMSIPDLILSREKLQHNIIQNISYIKKQPGHKMTGKRQQRIDEMKIELTEINRLLNIK